MICETVSRSPMRKLRYEELTPEFQRREHYLLAQLRQVVLVRLPDLLDQAMQPQAFEQAADLARSLPRDSIPQMTILKSTNGEFTGEDRLEKVQIIPIEEIEAPVRALAWIPHSSRELQQILQATGWLVEVGKEFQVPLVGRAHQLAQERQAVDGFLHGRDLHRCLAIAVLHFAAVFEKRHVIGGRLDAQDKSPFVVHLDRHTAHMVPYPSPFDPGMEVVAHLALEPRVERAAQKGRHITGLHRVDGGPDQIFVQRLEILSVSKHDIGGVFHLHQAPMVAAAEVTDHRAVDRVQLLQETMQRASLQPIGELLGPLEVFDVDEGVLYEGEADPSTAQPIGQVIVPVEVELKAKGRPGRYPQVAEAEPAIDKVEVVVQTSRITRPEVGLPGFLVVPGPEGATPLHGREDMDQAGVISAFTEKLLDTGFLAKVPAANEFDGQTILGRQALGVLPDLLAQGLGEVGVVEDPEAPLPQFVGHRPGIANLGNRARDDDPVEAGQAAPDLLRVPFEQSWRHDLALRLDQDVAIGPILSCGEASTCLVPATPG